MHVRNIAYGYVGNLTNCNCTMTKISLLATVDVCASLAYKLRKDRHQSHQSQIIIRWLRLSEQNFRVDKWNLCRG